MKPGRRSPSLSLQLRARSNDGIVGILPTAADNTRTSLSFKSSATECVYVCVVFVRPPHRLSIVEQLAKFYVMLFLLWGASCEARRLIVGLQPRTLATWNAESTQY